MFAESLEIAEGSVKSLTRKKGRGWCRGHSARLETRPPLKKNNLLFLQRKVNDSISDTQFQSKKRSR